MTSFFTCDDCKETVRREAGSIVMVLRPFTYGEERPRKPPLKLVLCPVCIVERELTMLHADMRERGWEAPNGLRAWVYEVAFSIRYGRRELYREPL